MTENSVLCRFIDAHPDAWEDILLKKYRVKVKKDGAYAIFNYSFDCDFHDPIVQEARGIIIDHEKRKVVCWPFRKFGNHNESYADPIDWEHARVLEKVDGSIIKLWYDERKGDWQFSTNGMIRAEEAQADEVLGTRFIDIIRTADNLSDIPYESLDRSLTYIFELVSPQSKVIVTYETASLYHIGTRSNLTGEEYELDIGIKKPAAFPIGSLADCISAAVALNRNEEGESGEVKKEGFVVVDRSWNRVKVKSPDYIMLHKLASMKTLSKRECVRILLEEPESVKDICAECPHLIPVFKFYDFAIAELCHIANKLAEMAKNLLAEYSGDRGAVARVISSHRLAFAAFRALDLGKDGAAFVLALSADRLCKFLPDYKTEDLRELFLKKK